MSERVCERVCEMIRGQLMMRLVRGQLMMRLVRGQLMMRLVRGQQRNISARSSIHRTQSGSTATLSERNISARSLSSS